MLSFCNYEKSTFSILVYSRNRLLCSRISLYRVLCSSRIFIPSQVFLDKNDTFCEGNSTKLDVPFKRLILFLEDGARPDFLFGNSVYRSWKPYFTDLLKKDPHHTICTTMQVDPPTSTTQGVKTFLTGGVPGFIELGQTFYASTLRSDHLLFQLHRKGKQ